MPTKVEARENGMFMVDYTIEGDSEAAVSAAIADVLRCYPTAGYGTAFHAVKAQNGRYTAHGYRSKSCE